MVWLQIYYIKIYRFIHCITEHWTWTWTWTLLLVWYSRTLLMLQSTQMITLLSAFVTTHKYSMHIAYTHPWDTSFLVIFLLWLAFCMFSWYTTFSENGHITLYLNMIRVDYWMVSVCSSTLQEEVCIDFIQ